MFRKIGEVVVKTKVKNKCSLHKKLVKTRDVSVQGRAYP
jgi:hypothetical protein